MLGLHHQLAAGVEERRRAVAPLLDVRRVGGADQHRAHLLADRAKRAGQDLQGDRVERPASWLAPPRSSPARPPSPVHPGGSTSVASGSSNTHGPCPQCPRRLAADHLGLDPLTAGSGACRGERVSRPPAAASGFGSGRGHGQGQAHVDQLHPGVGFADSRTVARARPRIGRPARRGPARPPGHAAARMPGPGSAARR